MHVAYQTHVHQAYSRKHKQPASGKHPDRVNFPPTLLQIAADLPDGVTATGKPTRPFLLQSGRAAVAHAKRRINSAVGQPLEGLHGKQDQLCEAPQGAPELPHSSWANNHLGTHPFLLLGLMQVLQDLLPSLPPLALQETQRLMLQTSTRSACCHVVPTGCYQSGRRLYDPGNASGHRTHPLLPSRIPMRTATIGQQEGGRFCSLVMVDFYRCIDIDCNETVALHRVSLSGVVNTHFCSATAQTVCT